MSTKKYSERLDSPIPIRTKCSKCKKRGLHWVGDGYRFDESVVFYIQCKMCEYTQTKELVGYKSYRLKLKKWNKFSKFFNFLDYFYGRSKHF